MGKIRKIKSIRRRRINIVPITLLAGVILALAFVILSLTVLFTLESIEVENEYVYSHDDIAQASGLYGGENLIRLNGSQIEKRLLASLPYIETVSVKKQLPSTLTVEYTVAEEYALIQNGAQSCAVDKNGRVLSENVSPREGLILLSGVGLPEASLKENAEKAERTYASFDDERTREGFAQLNSYIDEYEIKGVTRIDMKSYLDITFVIDDRVRVEVGTTVDMEYKFKYIRGLIDSDNIPADGYVILNVSNVERGASVRTGATYDLDLNDIVGFD